MQARHSRGNMHVCSGMQAWLYSGNMHVCSGSHNDEGGCKHGTPVLTCMYVVGCKHGSPVVTCMYGVDHIMMREGASMALQW